LSYMICGASRPGHFRGVATIVCKLFNMVQPNMAFFGEKDFQQLQVIKAMVTDLSMNLTIHGVPTEREADGLAMSSRNNFLNAEQRLIAPTLYTLISNMATEIKTGRRDFSVMIRENRENLAALGFKTDYIDIRSASSLLQPSHEDKELVILGAGFLGKTRIIDNIQVEI
jgi:pantoate--beta-alanine ligase